VGLAFSVRKIQSFRSSLYFCGVRTSEPAGNEQESQVRNGMEKRGQGSF
jgi:hypothetical protein